MCKTETILVLMPHTISDLCAFDISFLRHFVEIFYFQGKLILDFFFLANGITCFEGSSHRFCIRGGTATSTFTCLIGCLVQKILFWFSNIFSRIYLSAILKTFKENIFWHFSRGICVCVVSVNTNMFYSCCDNISTFPALF